MTDTDDEYTDQPPFGGAAPSPAPGADRDLLAAEIRALATGQAQMMDAIVASAQAVERLPALVSQAAQDAAAQQPDRGAELLQQVRGDVGQVLAAIAAQAPARGATAKRSRLRAWAWPVAGLIGLEAVSVLALAYVLSAPAPLGGLRGEQAQMAAYVWVTQGRTLTACLRQLEATGRGVECPVSFQTAR